MFYCFQIPGFYFDPDKNRYYRIRLGQGNMLPGAITANIVESKNEHKQSPVLRTLDSTRRQKANVSEHCFVSSFQNMQTGQATVRNVRYQMLSGIVQNLTWRNVVPVSPLVVDHEDEYQSYLKQIFCTTDENQLICRWCLQRRFDYPYPSDCPDSVLQRFEVNDAAKLPSERTTLQYTPVGCQQNAMQFKGIMSACIAQTDMLPDCHVTPVLYAAALQGQPFLLNAVAVLDSLDSSTSDHRHSSNSCRTFPIGKKWVWCCAWSPGLNNQFAIGTEKLAFLFDASTGKRFTLNTQSSDVMSQTFTSPVSVLFSFSDLILTWDICH